MLKNFARFLWGLVLIPWTLSTLYHLPEAGFRLSSEFHSVVLLLCGIAGYVLFEGLFSRPMRTYVFGHELTHALASLAMGGKVLSFNVSKKGGSVSLTKTNFFVALAPYCIPLYTFTVVACYYAFMKFYPFQYVQTVFLVLIGFTLAFHASLTWYAIRQEQPDIEKTGFFFSIVFIVLINAWVIIVVSKILFWNLISFKGFLWKTVTTQAEIWQWLFAKSLVFGAWIHEKWMAGMVK